MQNISVDLRSKKAILRGNSYFSGVKDPVLEELARGTHLRRYGRGEGLFWEGDPCAGLFIIHKGSVKLFKTSPQGRELIIKVFEEGATFNEVPVFDFGKNPVNAAALEESDLWLVEAEIIRGAMVKNPEMCQAVISNLAQNLRMLVALVEELSFYQVTNRLARLISQLPEEQLVGEGGQRLTQDQLAARLGTVREVVARSLRELERSGAIRVNRRQIEIMDAEALRDWVVSPLVE
ncbi:MAG: Crp/Fnr family transcriptional regulator [Chloroflexi bacterium]|nr:Crp/Fnr family transcriptional regulator [Chloroflexota bacterium]